MADTNYYNTTASPADTVTKPAFTDTRAPELQIVMSVMIVVPFIFMALRFYCKGKYGKLQWDDAVLFFSWVRLKRLTRDILFYVD
jgi:hypothetical protein